MIYNCSSLFHENKMPKPKKSPKTEVADLLRTDFHNEIILKTDANCPFEDAMSKSREDSDSTVTSLSSSTWKHTNKRCLTKVGHGSFLENEDAMIKFFHIKNDALILKFQLAMEQLKTIDRINLYGCKSGVVPLSSDRQPLEARVGIAFESREHERNQYGALSYAEYFILDLRKAYRDNGKELPRGLCVVACAGNIKDNNGKPTIAGSKHPPLKELFNEVSKSGWVKINCDIFLASYDNAIAAKPKKIKGVDEPKKVKKGAREESSSTAVVNDESKEERKGSLPTVIMPINRPKVSAYAQSFFGKPTSSSSSSSSSSSTPPPLTERRHS